jgi:1,4-alpha-glucan branching enzyme
MAAAVHAQAERLDRRVLVVAESDLNDARLIDQPSVGGCGLDGQWNDDFHHALQAILAGERVGYYHNFYGKGERMMTVGKECLPMSLFFFTDAGNIEVQPVPIEALFGRPSARPSGAIPL